MRSKLTKAKGNMYDWVTHTHSHLRGKCSHGCTYCYVQSIADRSLELKERYSGPVLMIPEALDTDYGTGKVIFIDHMNDLFADRVPDDWIDKVISQCLKFPGNQYVFQTKNPMRYGCFLDLIPSNSILGTTIESNRRYDCMGEAPPLFRRAVGMEQVKDKFQTFITIEPILDFDICELFDMMLYAEPSFINIGADSKDYGLEEPTFEKIMDFYDLLCHAEIEVRKKINLDRLKV